MKHRSLLFLIAGVFLLAWGYRASESPQSMFSELFTGAPGDKALWLMLAGLISTGWGLVRLVVERRR